MTEIYIASAFSKDGSGGNRAGVVIEGDKLRAQEKLELAHKLGYAETAFLSPSRRADFKLAYFTPKEEVPLCGHATIASFAVLGELHLLKRSRYTIETKSGILEIVLDNDGMIFMEQNTPMFYEILDISDVENCLDAHIIDRTLPIQIVSTGLRDLLIPVDSPEHLKEAVPDFHAISDLSRDRDIVGIHAFSLVQSDHVTAVCRNFAPLYGIEEESATGTSNCALACYLFRYGQRQKQYIFEQGHNLDNVSRIVVRIESAGDMVTGVRVGGCGYPVERQSMLHGL